MAETGADQRGGCAAISFRVEELPILGRTVLAASPRGLCLVSLRPPEEAAAYLRRTHPRCDIREDPPALAEAVAQLRAYLAGERRTFQLPLAPVGTPFQQQVWAALDRIPYGETRTYAQVAEDIGRPTASRAVGAANGANPLCIVRPCHRVIGSNGALIGYAYGLPTKQRLLRLEAG